MLHSDLRRPPPLDTSHYPCGLRWLWRDLLAENEFSSHNYWVDVRKYQMDRIELATPYPCVLDRVLMVGFTVHLFVLLRHVSAHIDNPEPT